MTDVTTWFTNAVDSELQNLANIPDENPNRPGSQFSICLIKLASLVNGSEGILSPDEIENAIKAALPQPYEARLSEKDLQRQWKRALQNAKPRQPKPAANGGSQAQAKPVLPSPAAPPQRTPNKFNAKNPKTHDYIAALKHLGIEMRLNELDDTIEVNQQPITDPMLAIIKNRLRDLGFSSMSQAMDAMLEMAYKNRYNPIRNYLDTLQWDGKDHIAQLLSFWVDTTGFAKTALTRWLIGSVAKIYKGGQNFMLVIDGPQGLGKSYFARWLCPVPEFFIEGPIQPNDKDDQIRACNHWIWEVAELQATTRRADREALKSFITQRRHTYRSPYGRYSVTKQATASFLGTINEDGAGFLTDRTGNRRFVVIRFTANNHKYATVCDHQQLWAQAKALFDAGEPWELTPAESATRDALNAEYQVETLTEILFWENYTIDPTSGVYTSITEIIQTLEAVGLKTSRITEMELARIMTQAGARRTRPREAGKRTTAYVGVAPVEKARIDL